MWTVLVPVTVLASLANILLTIGLIARIRVLQNMVAEQAGGSDDLPLPGAKVGAFSTALTSGEAVSDTALASGTTLVGFFAPACEPCQAAKVELLAKPPALPMLAFIDGSATEPQAAAMARELLAVARPGYVAHGTPTSAAFGIHSYPTLLRITNGAVVAAGRTLRDIAP